MSYVLITGASSGIGLALAKLFAKDHINIVLVARRSDRLNEISDSLEKEFNIKCLTIAKDLSASDSVKDVYDILSDNKIEIEYLVNNAGFIVYGSFIDTKWSYENKMIRLHIESSTYLTKLLLRDMVRRGRGRVLTICSTGSFVPGPYSAVYCATKSYLLSLSEALSEELKGSGVTATALCPGGTRTDFYGIEKTDNRRNKVFSLMDADVVAEVGYRALKKGKLVVIPGFVNKMQVFVCRFLPSSITTKVLKLLMSSFK